MPRTELAIVVHPLEPSKSRTMHIEWRNSDKLTDYSVYDEYQRNGSLGVSILKVHFHQTKEHETLKIEGMKIWESWTEEGRWEWIAEDADWWLRMDYSNLPSKAVICRLKALIFNGLVDAINALQESVIMENGFINFGHRMGAFSHGNVQRMQQWKHHIRVISSNSLFEAKSSLEELEWERKEWGWERSLSISFLPFEIQEGSLCGTRKSS